MTTKARKTGKRCLALFMTVLMLMSAWVFVAPTASAADHTKYRWSLYVHGTNTADSNDNGQAHHIYVYGKANNGTASSNTTILDHQPAADWFQSKNTYTNSGTSSAFPYNITIGIRMDGGTLFGADREWDGDVKLWVNDVLIIDTSIAVKGHNAYVTGSASCGSSWYPYKDEVIWTGNPSETVVELNAASTVTKTITPTGVIRDQWGVNWYQAPSYCINTSSSPTTTSNVGNGISISDRTITATSSGVNYVGNAGSKYAYVTAYYNSSLKTAQTHKVKFVNPSYTVVFNANGATKGATANQSMIYGQTNTLNKNGYYDAYTLTYNYNGATGGNTVNDVTKSPTFSKWNTVAGGTGTNYNDQQSVSNLTTTKNGTFNLYAQWTNPTTTLPTPTKDGYTFGGWYKDSSLSTSAGAAGATYTMTQSETLYAKWTKGNYTATNDNTTGTSGITTAVTGATDYSSTINANSGYHLTGDIIVKSGSKVLDASEYTYTVAGNKLSATLSIPAASVLGNLNINAKTSPHTYNYVEIDDTNHKQVCSDCNYVNVASEAHTWVRDNDASSTATTATCHEEVKDVYFCSKCGAEKVDVTDKTSHNYVEDTTQSVAATCQGPGMTVEVCQNCGDVKNTPIAQLSHDWQDTVDASALKSAATCSSAAVYYKTCANCGELSATQTFTNGSATSHSFTGTAITDNNGHHAQYCAYNCGTMNPTMENCTYGAPVVVTAPTCTEDGVSKETCSVCGYVHYFTTPASGHTFNGAVVSDGNGHHAYKCANCDAYGYMNGSTAVVGYQNCTFGAATPVSGSYSCISGAATQQECTECHYIKITNDTAGSHSYGDWTTVTSPTCYSEGLEERTCTICHIAKESRTISKTVHTAGDWVTVVPATCGKAGYKTKSCTVCGTILDTASIDALTHSFTGDYISFGNKHARLCANGCGLSGIGTTAGATENCSGGSATCTAPATCSVCGYSYGAALGHDFSGTLTNNGDGTHEVKCSRCDVTTTENCNFNSQSNVQASAATCTSPATYYYKCACGAQGTTTYTSGAALNHSYTGALKDNGDGTHSRLCANGCGTYGNAESHSWQEVASDLYFKSAATCTTAATYYKSCACGARSTQTFTVGSALGHDYTGTITAIGNGQHTIGCMNGCGTTQTVNCTYDQRVATQAYKVSDATCTAAETYYLSCVCGQHGTATFTVGAALGHDIQIVAPVAPTCTTAGNKLYAYCSVCNHLLIIDGADVESNGWTKSTDADKYNLAVDPDAHNYGDWVITTPANCTEDGVETRTCSHNANHTITRAVPATGHAYGDWEVTTPATCTTTGVETRTCANNNSHTLTRDIPATGHNYGPWTEAGETGHKHVCQNNNCTETETLPHEWINIVDESKLVSGSDCTTGIQYYKTCSVCGRTSTTQTFTVDGTTGHRFVNFPAKAETCTEDGYVHHYYCPVCNQFFLPGANDGTPAANAEAVDYDTDIKIDEISGHDFTGAMRDEGTNGHTFKCTRCDAYGNLTEHSYTRRDASLQYAKSGAAADCTSQAEYYYSCVCGRSEQNDAHTFTSGGALGHQKEKTNAVAATCTTGGHAAYWHCTRCDRYFSDEACTTQVTDLTTLNTNPLGHDMPATWTVVTPATCTDKGLEEKVCTRCNEYRVTQEINKTSHDYSNPAKFVSYHNGTHSLKCDVCGFIGPETDCVGQIFSSTAANCTTTGDTTYECTTCGYQWTVEGTATGPHNTPLTAHAATPATCTEPGNIAYYTCDLCGAAFKDAAGTEPATEADIVIPAYEHHNDATNQHLTLVPMDNPTCTANGTAAYYHCPICGGDFGDPLGVGAVDPTSAAMTIPALGHDFSGAMRDEGSSGHSFKCIRCNTYGAEIGGEMKTVAEGGVVAHGFSQQIVNDSTLKTAATCTEAAVYYKSCVCGAISSSDSDTFTVGNPLGHDWSGTPVSNNDGTHTLTCARQGCSESRVEGCIFDAGVSTDGADCQHKGTTVYTCTKCDYEKTVNDDYGPHSLTSVAKVDATCTAPGTEAHYKCTLCNKLFSDENGNSEILDIRDLQIGPKGHNWGAWTVNTEPTCTTAGEESRSCQRDGCGETETATIPALGHKLIHVTAKAATCEAAGNSEYWLCAVCSKYFNNADGAAAHETTQAATVIPASGHDFGTTAIEVAGGHQYECSRCHGFGDGTTIGEVESHTFNQTTVGPRYLAGEPVNCGDTTTYYKSCMCGAVGEDTFQGTGTLDHVKHNYAAVAATCAADGNVAYSYCSRCNKYFDSNDTETTLEAVTISKSTVAHTWGENDGWTTLTEATCTEQGSERRECSVCHKVETRTTDALGHEFDPAEGATPVKNNDGTHSFKCVRCDVLGAKIGNEQKLKADGGFVTCSFGAWQPTDGTNCSTIGSKKCECEVCHYEKVENGNYGAHNLSKTEAVAATCTQPGRKAYWTCSICGKIFADENAQTQVTDLDTLIVDASGHALTQTPASAADCTQEGNTAYYTCSTCGHYFSDALGQYEIAEDSWVIPQKAHDYSGTIRCLNGNKHEFQCVNGCGQFGGAVDHTYDKAVQEGHLKSAATCTEAATYYYSCVCGASGTETFTVGNPLGHQFNEVDTTKYENGWKWTAEGEGYTAIAKLKCTRDGCTETIDRDAVVTYTTAGASCTGAGTITYTAKVKLDNNNEVSAQKEKSVPVLGHDWGAPTYSWSKDGDDWKCTATRTCKRDGCNEVETETLTGTLARTAPTCVADGSDVYTADFENEAFETQTKTIILDALGHDFNAVDETKTGDGWDAGWKWTKVNDAWTAKATLTCSRCDATVERDAIVTFTTNGATCGAEGSVVYTATVTLDGGRTKTDTKTETVPILPHDYDWAAATFDWVKNGDTYTVTATVPCKNTTEEHPHTPLSEQATVTKTHNAPTCTELGSDVYTATFTHFPTQTKVDSIPALGHAFNVVLTTLNDDGWTTGWKWTELAGGGYNAVAMLKCTHAGCTETVERQADVTSTTSSATCEGAGSINYTAAVMLDNGEWVRAHKPVETGILGHKWKFDGFAWTGDDTNGYETNRAILVCENDPAHTAMVEAEMLPTITVYPGCETNGSRTYSATVTIPAGYGEISGEKYNDSKVVTDAAKSHDWQVPTFTTPVKVGDHYECTAIRVCSRDAENHRQTKDIESAVGEEIHPTCTEPGSITYTFSVTFDGVVYTRDSITDVIPAKGHKMPLIYHEAVPATCEAPGSIEYWTCEDCNAKFGDAEANTISENITVPALGHDFTGDPIDNNNETHSFKCKHEGCTKVGVGTGETAQVDGTETCSYGDWIIITNATCTDTGLRKHICRICDHVETEEIPMLPHSLRHYSAKNATCLADGNIEYYYCSMCKRYFTSDAAGAASVPASDIVLPKLPHSYTGDVKNNGDGTHSFRCVNGCNLYGGREGHDFISDESKREDRAYLCSYADCENPLRYYRSCAVCSAVGTETFDVGTPLGHTWLNFSGQPETCYSDGHTPYQECERCHIRKGFETINDFVGHGTYPKDSDKSGSTADGTISWEYHYCDRMCGDYYMNLTIVAKDSTGTRVPNVNVTITNSAGQTVDSGKTNTNAEFKSSKALREGTYTVSLEYVRDGGNYNTHGTIKIADGKVTGSYGKLTPYGGNASGSIGGNPTTGFRCSMCDMYDSAKNIPVYGWFISIIHAFVHAISRIGK